MLKVGLTGGLASGKSFIAAALGDLGCMVIHADQLGHEALAPEGAAYAAVVREFGPAVLDPEGYIDRRALAAQVFGKPARLEALNAIVHPVVLQRELELMAAFARLEPGGIAVLEAAILIETGSYRRFDKIVLAACDEATQIRRAVKRDGLLEAEVRERLRHQMPLSEKRNFADYVIDTSGEKEHTLAQTRTLYENLRRIAK